MSNESFTFKTIKLLKDLPFCPAGTIFHQDLWDSYSFRPTKEQKEAGLRDYRFAADEVLKCPDFFQPEETIVVLNLSGMTAVKGYYVTRLSDKFSFFTTSESLVKELMKTGYFTFQQFVQLEPNYSFAEPLYVSLLKK